MIRYVLKCDRGHEFESWFASSSAYDALAKAGQVSCAVCGTSRVSKAPMTPSVVTTRGRDAREGIAQTTASLQPSTAFRMNAVPPELKHALRRIRDHVKAHADYVGPRFAEEARKIHYEEAPSRGIYGEATAEDVRSLKDEGIEFHPLPVLPDDRN